MKIRKTRQFEECYESLPDSIKKKAIKALELLLTNPQHPSLNLKKIKGVKGIWYGRINRYYRFTFQVEGEYLILRCVGPHNGIIKKP